MTWPCTHGCTDAMRYASAVHLSQQAQLRLTRSVLLTPVCRPRRRFLTPLNPKTCTTMRSLTIFSTDLSYYMTVGAIGSCAAAVAQPMIACPVPVEGSSLEAAMKLPNGSAATSTLTSGTSAIVSWLAPGSSTSSSGAAAQDSLAERTPLPLDWRPLVKAGLKALFAVCIRAGPKDQLLGMLNVGFTDPGEQEFKVRWESVHVCRS